MLISPQSNYEGVHAFLYCYLEKFALTIRFIKKLGNGKFLVEEFEAIPYNPNSTPNGKMLLLSEESFYKIIKTSVPLVVLMGA
jgi:hypothetical protein